MAADTRTRSFQPLQISVKAVGQVFKRDDALRNVPRLGWPLQYVAHLEGSDSHRISPFSLALNIVNLFLSFLGLDGAC